MYEVYTCTQTSSEFDSSLCQYLRPIKLWCKTGPINKNSQILFCNCICPICYSTMWLSIRYYKNVDSNSFLVCCNSYGWKIYVIVCGIIMTDVLHSSSTLEICDILFSLFAHGQLTGLNWNLYLIILRKKKSQERIFSIFFIIIIFFNICLSFLH